MTNTQTKQSERLLRIVATGLMAALVFVGNYMQFKIPVAIGDVTRIHLGNSMCLLAGLLFGPSVGGMASGIGAALFDLLDPVYIISAPYTFCSKFAMGFIAGLLNRNLAGEERRYRTGSVILSGVFGQLTYIALYLLKSYVTLRLLGTAPGTAFTAVIPKIITSSVNAAAAVLISVPLFFALQKALSHTGFGRMTAKSPEKKGYWNPVTVFLMIYCCAATLVFSLYLSATGKMKAAEEKKEAAIQSQLTEYEEKLRFLADELGITLPESEEKEE